MSSKNLQRKRFVDTAGKHVWGKQKRSQAIKKSRENKVGENENSNPIPIRATKTNGTQDD
jgi:hypothetical protein